MIHHVQLLTVAKKQSPLGVVYSTFPWVGPTTEGTNYIVKGPESDIVAAEGLAGRLLRELNLPGVVVPEFASAVVGDLPELLFASKYMQSVSPIDPHLPRHREEAAAITAADVWLCNKDRNIGNYLLDNEPATGSVLVAIDFEGSVAARRFAAMMVPSVDIKSLWPRELAGRMLGRLPWPEATIAAIEQIDRSTIEAAAKEVAVAFPCFTWVQEAVDCIAGRAAAVRPLARQVWNACNPN